MKKALVLVSSAVLVAGVVACSGDDADGEGALDAALTTIVSSEGTPPPVQVELGVAGAVGPGISVGEALDSTLDGPLLVNGFIFTRAGDVWLCSSLPREEYPTCGEPSIAVTGLDPTTIEGIEFLEGIGWSDEATQVLGEVTDGVLAVSSTSMAAPTP